MSGKQLRVGIIGAGQNTKLRHLPGLREQPDVQVVAVANRTAASAEKAARLLEIPKAHADWQSLIADPEIDAVVIGTWPNTHAEMTCAALAAGKHVLCEARMARSVAEAKTMVDAAAAHPDLTAMVVPSPFGLTCEAQIQGLLKHFFIGHLREVVVVGAEEVFHDYSEYLHWRQDAEISGVNTLSLGILHETVSRWIPQPTSVFAQTQIFEPQRPSPHGPGMLPVTVPESVQVLTQYENGARGIYHFGGLTLFGPGHQIHLYGSQGALRIVFKNGEEQVWAARVGDPALAQLEIPADKIGKWRVEEEFVHAIRGQEPVRRNDFATAYRDLMFTEAVLKSAEKNSVVRLPLSV